MKTTCDWPDCGQKIEYSKEYAGKALPCPKCGRVTTFPPLTTGPYILQWLKNHKWWIVGGVGLLALIVFPVLIKTLGATVLTTLACLFALLPIALLVCLYFLPSIVAKSRNNPQTEAIFVANLFFGWTLVGWALCMVWAHIK